jgi:hypothetical protein
MRIWLIGLASICFALATVTNLVGHHVVPAIVSGLAACCFTLLVVVRARSR